MKSELHDVVNEKDEVIGQATKKELIEKHLLHRVVHIFIFNSDDRLAIQKRSSKVLTMPGKLTSSASGTVAAGESYEDAAKRELKEELGVETELNYISKFWTETATTNAIGKLFVGKYEGKIKIDKNEVDSVIFFDLDSLEIAIRNKPDMFSENFKNAFKEYMKYEEE